MKHLLAVGTADGRIPAARSSCEIKWSGTKTHFTENSKKKFRKNIRRLLVSSGIFELQYHLEL